jgi:stage V sporulation protein G
MEITEVRVSIRNEERLKAYVTVTFDNCFVVRHIRIVKTEKGLLVSMPSRKLSDGTHKDIAHPITQEFRKKLETKVVEEYEKELKNQPAVAPVERKVEKLAEPEVSA